MRDATDDQKFLRPRGGVRRSEGGRRDGYGRLGIAAAALLLGAVIGHHVQRYLSSSPALMVRSVSLAGLERTSGAALDDFALRLIGRNMLALDLAAVESELRRANPWVRRATLRRVFPDRIEIFIEEHQPVARLAGGEWLVTAGGQRLPAEPALAGDEELPRIDGEPQQLTGRGLRRALRVLSLLGRGRAPLAKRVAAVDAGDEKDVVVALGQDWRLHLGASDFVARLNRFHNAEPILRQRYSGGGPIELDLRYRARIVVANAGDRSSGS